jgi:hypothetical protein
MTAEATLTARPKQPKVEMPFTPPEPGRHRTVTDDIREANARTTSEVQQLFCDKFGLSYTREQVKAFRDAAWGKPPQVKLPEDPLLTAQANAIQAVARELRKPCARSQSPRLRRR